jgi:RNA polymerase sigma-70 factor (ECF subfamily)
VTDGDVTPSGGQEDSTSLSLLDRARSGEPAAWRRLVSLYEPLVHRWCRRANLQEADAADVCQDVFLAVSSNIEEFRREADRGTFRGWLRTITRSKLSDLWRRKSRSVPEVGGSEANEQLAQVADIPADDDDQALSEEKQVLYRRALDLIQQEFEERSWKAFWLVVVEDRSPADVARELGTSVNAVYLAKSRVLARLRSEFAGILDD